MMHGQKNINSKTSSGHSFGHLQGDEKKNTNTFIKCELLLLLL